MGFVHGIFNKSELSPRIRQAVDFTEVYASHSGGHPALREAECLKIQVPAILTPLEDSDLFAGGCVRQRLLYVGTIWWAMLPSLTGPHKQGGYCYDFDDLKYAKSDADREALKDLRQFWKTESVPSKIEEAFGPEEKKFLDEGGQIRGGQGGGFCVAPNTDILLTLGIPGLDAKIRERIEKAERESNADGKDFYTGLKIAVRLLTEACENYASQAAAIRDRNTDPEIRSRMNRIAEALDGLTRRPPKNLFEAIQLWWLYNLLASGKHFEGWRIDAAFGDFYQSDIDSGLLDEEGALQLVIGLWGKWHEYGERAVSRAIVGGKGRRNEAAADRFSLAAMEATRRLKQVIPQLTLRFYAGQNPALMEKAFQVIGEGCTYPMLYNDDVVIPGMKKILHVDEKEAELYYPLGCGEYMVGGASPSLLVFGWNIPKSVEAALFGGYSVEGRQIGPETSSDFSTYEELWNSLLDHVAYSAKLAARTLARNIRIVGRECSFLFGSLLTEDCLARGKSMLDGGSRYVGGCLMSHGMTNAADSLTAVRKLVFEDKAMSLDRLRAALKDDFKNDPDAAKMLKDCVKFGNDADEADSVLVKLWQEVSRLTDEAGTAEGLGFLTVSSVNPGGYGMGLENGATADGRVSSQPFAIGNAPTAGNDTHGLTALLNSISKVDPANGGATTSVKLAKEMFTKNLAKLKAIFSAFWDAGGQQSTITVVSQQDLLDALDHPERYPNLLVRVGGWTARFVDLEKHIQQDVIKRTVY